MGTLTLKALAKQIDIVADDWLPQVLPFNEQVVAWANLHGWDVSGAEDQRLLIRQALLNAVIRQTVTGIAGKAFVTPLDSLGVKAPQSLIDVISEAVQCSYTTTLNFWGDLYSALIPQAQRRRIGQFWTNEQIAEWMVTWLLQFHPRHLVDVGCGAGNFLQAAQRLAKPGSVTELYGCDISPLLLNVTLATCLTRHDGQPPAAPTLFVQDYLSTALSPGVDAVVCNPPYTRHHHITPELKDTLYAFFKARLYLDVSRQATLAFYFLLKTIAEIPDGAHAAVIVPMEVLDARYGRAAKRALCQYTSLSAIIHFSPQMNAFHKVDVGATILLFKKGYEKQNQVCHLTLNALPTTQELIGCLDNCAENRDLAYGSLAIQPQDDLLEVPKWFNIATPEPSNAEWQSSGLVVPLKALAKVVRGIATGANEFFALPTQKVRQYSLEPFVVRTLQRNREIQDIVLDEAKWQALSDEGKCVWLLYLSGDDVSRHPVLRLYLAEGESKGYHQRSLVQTRKKWYAMEQRDVPAIFFTILTRGNPRFILNRAGVRPLNMFSLVYPNRHVTEADATDLLWALLNCSFSLSRLHSVSRTYGGNTLKVEPRELDNLPVINPLALPDEARQKIKGWIADFYRHRQVSVLTRQIDELVGALLVVGTTDTNHSSLPVQPRLLEKGKGYEGAE
jgi:adenine-specific DNA-methyltransferase